MAEGAAGGLRVRGLSSRLVGPFDLDLEPGGALAIVGPSGAGKSLLLRLIADLDPGDGRVELGGVDRSRLSGPQWRRRAPYVSAEPGWWSARVADHFDAGSAERSLGLAQQLGLDPEQWGADPARLSTGEARRWALARALALDPPLLLLDEPTGPLDPSATQRVEALLAARAATGRMLILSTHDGAQPARLAARVQRLERGRFAA